MKIIRIVQVFLLSLLMIAGAFTPVMAENKDFDEFLNEETNKILADDFGEFHFAVIDYKKFNLEKPEVRLPYISYEFFAAEAAQLQESLNLLHQFDYDSLDERQQHDYLVYEEYLKTKLALDQFPDFQELYNPYTGLYEGVITSLTEFVLYDRESAEDYLTLIEDFPRFLNEMNEFTKQQAAKGYFLTDALLDEALEKMKAFIEKGEENPLIILYELNLDKLVELTEEEKNTYKEKNRDLVTNALYPALENTRTVLESLRGSRSVSGSLYEYEGGQAYYAALANSKCASDDSLEEKKDYLAKCLSDIFNYSLSHFGNPVSRMSSFQSPEEILAYLGEHMEDFPEGPELQYTLSYLDQCVANPSVVAYYVQTPMDNVTNNVIRINGDNTKDDPNTLYLTLAHEGLPGHMYQFAWYYSQEDTVPLRHVVTSLGYAEGWAQYVQRILTLRSPLSEADAEFVMTASISAYTMQAYIDVLVNGFGYDTDDIIAEMEKIGLSNMQEKSVSEIVEAALNAPGQILPYGYGMCKMWEYNERVQASLGDSFNLEEFHLQLLKYGPRNYEIIESDLQKYVESKGAEFVKDFKLFTYSATEESTEGLISLITSHIWIAVAVLLVILILLFLLIRGIIRLITGKKKKKAKE